MQEKVLQIVSFDSPFPPNYGGVIDVFYKIKALHAIGYKIILHCFVDRIPLESSNLDQYVTKVYYYKNKKSIHRFFSKLPYSVCYRQDNELLTNINKLNCPIIFESLKTSYLLKLNNLPQRTILRLHNIEHNYFLGISKSEKNLILKLIYYLESLKYKSFETVINKFDTISTLSIFETNYISDKFKTAYYTPLFHGNKTVKNLSNFGNYTIYNGDLRTSDNRRAVLFLIDIFKELKNYNFVIAASDKQDWVENRIKHHDNISFIKLDNYEHLKDLFSMAHISIMASFQESGTKLKLINALFNSRHCLINEKMIDDNRILDLCELAKTKDHFIKKIIFLSKQPYSDYEKRKKVLNTLLNDETNALSLLKTIEN